MGSKLRPIYLAKSLNELNTIAAKGISPDTTTSLQKFQKLLDTLVLKSKTESLEGDQELSYVYAVRALDVYLLAKKSQLSPGDKSYLAKYFSGTISKLMTECELLSHQLEKRYEKHSKDAQEKDTSVSLSIKASETAPVKTETSVWIYSEELYRVLKNAESLLILDARPEEEFNECHIDSSQVVNVPDDILSPGVTVTRLDQCLSLKPSFHQLWTSRGNFDSIVLMDWNTNMITDSLENGTSSHPLHLLYRVIMKWDSQHLVKEAPQLLYGGLQEFIDRYPTCVTSSTYTGPKHTTSSTNGRKMEIDELINYPTLLEPISSIKINDEEDFCQKSEKVDEAQGSVHPLSNPTSEGHKVNRSNKPKHTSASTRSQDLDGRVRTKPPPSRPPKPPHMRTSNEAPASISLNKAMVSTGSYSDGSETSAKDSRKQNFLEKTDSSTQEVVASRKISVPLEDIGSKATKLPRGWFRVHDQKTNRYYYFNHEIQEGTYDPPVEIVAADVPIADMDDRRLKKTSREEQKDGSLAPRTPIKRSSSQPAIDRVPLSTASVSPPSSTAASCVAEVSTAVVPDRSTKPKPQSPSGTGGVAATAPSTKTGMTPHKDPHHRIQELSANQIRSLNATYGTPGPGLTGLRNLGNTCYMNSVLQALCNTPLLYQYFREGHYLRDLNADNPLGHKGRMAQEFGVIIQAVWSNCYLEISPRDFKDMVDNSGYIFAGSQQQDSQEFLLFILDGLHEDLNQIRRRPKVEPLMDEEVNRLNEVQHGELSWERYLLLNKSVIVQAFQGQLKSTLRCCTCGRKSVTFDAFMYLSLPLINHSECSLMDCLMLFLREERMTGDSQWRCPKCKQNRDAIKKIDLWKLPPYLLIHLKRFNSSRQKLNTAVNFPVDNLEVTRFVCGPKKPEIYRLYAISNHYGRMEGGHYTAHCRNPLNRQWYLFDDEKVSQTSSRDIQSSAAYILFYDSTKLRR